MMKVTANHTVSFRARRHLWITEQRIEMAIARGADPEFIQALEYLRSNLSDLYTYLRER